MRGSGGEQLILITLISVAIITGLAVIIVSTTHLITFISKRKLKKGKRK